MFDSPSMRLLVFALTLNAGCSAIFDGSEYLSSDAAVGDSATDTTTDTAPPDPCGGACGSGQVCEPMAMTCVGCLVDHDCTGDATACDTSTHTCVQCTAMNQLACGGETPVCDTADDARRNTCVACNADADCPDSAPVCDAAAHTCGGCADDTDCADRAGAPACDTTSGACVACNASTATANCPATGVCTAGHVCSAYGSGTQGQCQECDAEENCAANHDCVPMTFGDPAVDHGSYCLKLATAGCEQPYSVSLDATSLGGATARYCGLDQAVTTCEAVLALVNNMMCPTGDDADCPEGGLCRTVGVLEKRCTYACLAARQCLAPGTGADTCGTGTGGVSYCGG